MLNQLGDFTFIDIRGVPLRVTAQLEMVARPGVDGLGFWHTGRRGQPFQIETLVDAEDKAGAMEFYRGYTDLIGIDPQPMTWHDINVSTADQVLFQVIDVKPLDVRSLAAASSGGLNPPSLGWCHCGWLLVPVEVTE